MDLISFCIDFVLSGIIQLFVFVKKMWLQGQRVYWPVALFLLWEDKCCRYVNLVYITLYINSCFIAFLPNTVQAVHMVILRV